MKGGKEKKTRFMPQPLAKIKEDPPEPKQKRPRYQGFRKVKQHPEQTISGFGHNGTSKGGSKAGSPSKWRAASRSLFEKVKKGELTNVVKAQMKANKSVESGPAVPGKGKQIKTPENKTNLVKNTRQKSTSQLQQPVNKSPVKSVANKSPSNRGANSPLSPVGKVKLEAVKGASAKDLTNQDKLQTRLTLKDCVNKLPVIPKRNTFGDMLPIEDSFDLPFGGSRRLSDSNMVAAQEATNVIYMINQARKKRLKESINAQIAAVHDRVRKALEHADIYEGDEENKEEDPSEPKFDTRSKRETMKYRNEMIYKMRENIEACHKRMVLILDVNKWLHAEQKDLNVDLVSDEELEEETTEHYICHKKIMYSLETLTDCVKTISVIGHKIIEMASKIMNATKKGKVDKIQVVDEKTMLSNKAKWDQAVANILTVFDDASRWVKGPQFKAALRNGKKQYQVIISAVDKRLAELSQMSRLVEDLQNKLMMSKEMINKYAKDADEYKRMVDQLSKELEEIKQEMSQTLETNKRLTSQLTDLEGQVKEMKEELSKPPLPPPRPPSPPTPEPPQQSESSKQLMEDTQKHLKALELEIQEYRILVHNLSARIDELQDQLENEQMLVRSLKEKLESQPVVEPRPPEPVVGIPVEPTPPPEMFADSSSSYYKTLISGMKKDFMVEVDKLKDHLKREQNRNDASLRRMEQFHKDQIHGIMKDCHRVLRAIAHFRDQVAIMLDKEGFSDSARELHQLPKLVQDNISQDPKDILMYMAGSTVDYLHSMEVVLSHTMLAIKIMQKSGSVGSHPPISEDEVFKQMETRMEEIRQPSKIQSVMKSPVRRASDASRRRDKQCIKKLQGTVDVLENKYMCLLDRYKMVWKLYNDQTREMETLQEDFDRTVLKKVKQKESMFVSAIKAELKERRAIRTQQLQMTIADQRKNLQLLDKALNENKISRELHQMTTSLLQQALEIPRKRFRYLIERYIAHCAVKEAETKVLAVLREEKLTPTQKSEIVLFMEQMKERLRKGLSIHHQDMERLETERRGIFREIWTVFNEVLVDTGVLLIQPVFTEKRKVVRQETAVRLRKRRQVTVKIKSGRHQFMEMPTSLMGCSVPLTFKMDKPMWQKQPPSELSPDAAVTTPKFLDMDINRQLLLAKRKLKKGPRMVYPIAESRSFTISDEIQVDYISTSLMSP